MIRFGAATVEALADRLGQELGTPPDDPFAQDLILTEAVGSVDGLPKDSEAGWEPRNRVTESVPKYDS
jgi:hypothetical protein